MKAKRERSSILRRVMERLTRLLRPKSEPEDPHAYVIAPLRRPPRGRSGAALAELDEK